MNLKKLVMSSILTLSLSTMLGSTAKSENCETRVTACKALLQKAVQNLESQQATIDGLAEAARAREAVLQEQDKQLKEAQKNEKAAKTNLWWALGALLLKVAIL